MFQKKKILTASFLALAICSLQPTLSLADVSADPSATPNIPNVEDSYELSHLQPGTEITLPLNAVIPSDTNLPLGDLPARDEFDHHSCSFVPSESKQDRAVNGTFVLTVTVVGHSLGGLDFVGESTFNGIPQKNSPSIHCYSGFNDTIGDFKALIERNGGKVKSPAPIQAQQL